MPNFWEVLLKSAGQAATEFPEYNRQKALDRQKQTMDRFNMAQQAKRTQMEKMQTALRILAEKRLEDAERFKQENDPEVKKQRLLQQYGELSKIPENDLLANWGIDMASKYYPSTLDLEKIQRERELHNLKLEEMRANIEKKKNEANEDSGEKNTEKLLVDMVKGLGTQTKKKTIKTDEGETIEEVPMFGVPELKARADSLATYFLKHKSKPNPRPLGFSTKFDKPEEPEPQQGTLEWEWKRRGLQ